MTQPINSQSKTPYFLNEFPKILSSIETDLIGRTLINHQKYEVTFHQDEKQRVYCICQKDGMFLRKEMELVKDLQDAPRNILKNPYALTVYPQEGKIVLGSYGLKGGMYQEAEKRNRRLSITELKKRFKDAIKLEQEEPAERFLKQLEEKARTSSYREHIEDWEIEGLRNQLLKLKKIEAVSPPARADHTSSSTPFNEAKELLQKTAQTQVQNFGNKIGVQGDHAHIENLHIGDVIHQHGFGFSQSQMEELLKFYQEKVIEETQRLIGMKTQELIQQGKFNDIREVVETIEKAKGETIQSIEQEKRTLSKPHQPILQQAEKEKQALAQEKEKILKDQQKVYEKKDQELTQKISTIETQKIEQQKLQKGAVPEIAFGKAKWQKYFGDIGTEPPLPKDIDQILKSPCPFWSGKRVEETHLLVLVPSAVNGKAFTLNTLQELIKSPKTGNKTQYSGYSSYVKNELGNKSESAHWVLMTRDIIPDSRSKTYDYQKALVATHAQRTKIPYELPTALESATAILMEHVQTGNRIYSDDPNTYTRCQEKVNNNQWPVTIGSFSAGGLSVTHILHWHDNDCGVGCCRKL